MIKVYKLKIGEKIYEVELEDITKKEGNIESNKNNLEIKNNIQKEDKKEIKKDVNAQEVKAPMQGVILDILVSVGDEVKAEDEVVILEAMKMENPIVSGISGKVLEICISKGDSVEDGTVMMKIG